MLAVLVQPVTGARAQGETRTISFHHTHTNEDLTVTYKRNGRYDEEALKKINNVLRDWRASEPITMDPQVIDLLWEVHREVGAKEPISIVCGYRSPGTNAMLRSRSSGVAKFSQHMNGKAIDFFIPGVSLQELQAAGLRAQRGGVGIYPSSGFVHMDTGSVRHWPRMPEAQMARILAKGGLASQSASDNASSGTIAQASLGKPSFLSRVFRGQEEDDNDASTVAETTTSRGASARSARGAAPKATSAQSASQERSKERSKERSQERSQEPSKGRTDKPQLASATPAGAKLELASATSKPVRLAQAAVVAQASAAPAAPASSASGAVAKEPAQERRSAAAVSVAETAQTIVPRTPAAVQERVPAGIAIASADSAFTASFAPWPLAGRAEKPAAPNALSYAAQPSPIAALRGLPVSSPAARGESDKDEGTSTVKRGEALLQAPATLVQAGDRFNDPWLRAMIVSPSAQAFMRASLFGEQDLRSLIAHMHKPASAVLITFKADPNVGVPTEKFSGSAVVFVSTVSFAGPRTAALR
ncbi:MAG: DUF882 domain-containing protein [Xanthobacteraceae bacterium]